MYESKGRRLIFQAALNAKAPPSALHGSGFTEIGHPMIQGALKREPFRPRELLDLLHPPLVQAWGQ